MSVFEIPLTPSQNQRLGITLDTVPYTLVFNWVNADQGGWALDILDSNGIPILEGLAMITGADLLSQFGYLGITGHLIVNTSGDPDAIPTYTNLGNDSHLYYVTAT